MRVLQKFVGNGAKRCRVFHNPHFPGMFVDIACKFVEKSQTRIISFDVIVITYQPSGITVGSCQAANSEN